MQKLPPINPKTSVGNVAASVGPLVFQYKVSQSGGLVCVCLCVCVCVCVRACVCACVCVCVKRGLRRLYSHCNSCAFALHVSVF